ncbi:syndecan-3-like [Saccoglossus kowalevskii]|uniref:Syndecan n=1 Tax=Saccoglossus kowalevskii TaxID=10224 RepID=A0A0U2USG9_SACKO|nr:syndecan-like 081 [Saccoglossus kowalevskii]
MRLFLRSWILLGVIAAIYGNLVKRQSNGVESNSMSLEAGESHAPVIDIDDKPVVSSGDETEPIDLDDSSGDLPDDEDFDDGSGSGYEPYPVIDVTAEPSKKTIVEKTQKPGGPTKSSVTKAPKRPKPEPTEGVDNNKLPDIDIGGDSDITVDPADDKMSTISNDIIPDGENDVEFSTGPPNSIGNSAESTGTASFMELLFSNPAILAAIIAGGVIALLSAILLVMFIVYRMRKKDEGSYSLDEPKKYKDPNMYWKDTGKEFYA